MANPIKISDLIDPGLKKELEAIEKQYKDIAEAELKALDAIQSKGKKTSEVLKAQEKFNTNLIGSLNKLNELEKKELDTRNKLAGQAKRATTVQSERIKLEQKLKTLRSDSIQQNEVLKVQISEQRKINKQLAREQLGLVSAYDKLSRELNDARKKYKDLAVAQGENSRAARQQLKEVTRLDNRLKRIDRNVGQFQRNIGNYGKAFRSLTGIISAAGVTLGAAGIFRVVGNGIRILREFGRAQSELAGVLGKTRKETRALSDDAARLGAVTARTAQEVTELQIAYARLGFTQEQIINLTESTISGSIALNSELGATAELVGAVVKSFDDFSTTDAPQIVDQLVLSTQRSALSFEKLQTAIPIVAGAANAAGVSFQRLLTLLGTVADRGIDASSAATSLRNIFIESGKRGESFEKGLQRIANSQDQLTAANAEFGKRAAVTAVILAKNEENIRSLDKALTDFEGTAQRVADEQLNNLDGRLTLLNSAWEGLVIGLEQGDGRISKVLSNFVDSITDVVNAVNELNTSDEQLFREDALGRFLESGKQAAKELISELDGIGQQEQFLLISDQIEALEKNLDASRMKLRDLGGEFNLAQLETEKEVDELGRLNKVTQDAAIWLGNLTGSNRDQRIELTRSNAQLEAIIVAYKEYRGTLEEVTDGSEDLNDGLGTQARTIAIIEKEITDLNKKIKESDILRSDEIDTINKAIRVKEIELKQARFRLGLIDEENKRLRKRIDLQRDLSEEFNKAVDSDFELDDVQLEGDFDKLREAVDKFRQDEELSIELVKQAEQEIKDNVIAITNEITQARIDAAEIQLALTEQLIDSQKEYINELKSDLRVEKQLRAAGAANQVEEVEAKIKAQETLLNRTEEQRQRDLENSQRVQRQQVLINAAIQGSELTLATAKIIQSSAALGPAAPFVAAGTIAGILGLFASTVSQIRNINAQSQFGDGGSWIEGGRLHSQGGNNYGDKQLEKGERVSVFSRQATTRHNSEIVDFTNAVNSGKLSEYMNNRSMLYTKPINNMIYSNNNGDVVDAINSHMGVSKDGNKILKRMVIVDQDGNATDLFGNSIYKA